MLVVRRSNVAEPTDATNKHIWFSFALDHLIRDHSVGPRIRPMRVENQRSVADVPYGRPKTETPMRSPSAKCTRDQQIGRYLLLEIRKTLDRRLSDPLMRSTADCGEEHTSANRQHDADGWPAHGADGHRRSCA
jgi:hypothetical protein